MRKLGPVSALIVLVVSLFVVRSGSRLSFEYGDKMSETQFVQSLLADLNFEPLAKTPYDHLPLQKEEFLKGYNRSWFSVVLGSQKYGRFFPHRGIDDRNPKHTPYLEGVFHAYEATNEFYDIYKSSVPEEYR